jgi:hypothetical protein
MSRKRARRAVKKRASQNVISRSNGTNKTIIRTDYPPFAEFLRERDPDVMVALSEAFKKRRTLFSWLTPGTIVKGIPAWAGPHLPWLTLVDDLIHRAAAGPDSFDKPSLDWWINNRALALVVDAAKSLPEFYGLLPSFPANGQGILVVQTVEGRRLIWHEYFRAAASPGIHVAVVDMMNTSGPGKPRQLLRGGRLGDDFGPNGVLSSFPFAALARRLGNSPFRDLGCNAENEYSNV